MALRVSLQIDGDAKGAEAAAAAASRAITDLGKSSDASSKALETGFEKAFGSVSGLANAAKAAGAANDNAASSALGFAAQLDQVAQKALGADTAFAKVSSGAINVAKGVAGLSASADTIGLLTGAVGVAIAAASTFYGIVNDGAARSSKLLGDNEKQIGIVRDAFKDAASTAGDFFVQTSNVSKLLLTPKGEQLKGVLQSQVGQVVSGATTFGDIGSFFSKTKQVREEFLPFEDAIFRLQKGFKMARRT